jgi:hypothetical protein
MVVKPTQHFVEKQPVQSKHGVTRLRPSFFLKVPPEKYKGYITIVVDTTS